MGRYSWWSAYVLPSDFLAMITGDANDEPLTAFVRHIIIVSIWTLLALVITVVWWTRRESTSGSNSIEDDVVAEASQATPVEMAESAARRRAGHGLSSRRRPKVSITLDNILFSRTLTADTAKAPPASEEDLPVPSPGPPMAVQLISRSVAPFLALCEMTNIFPISRVDSDEDAEEIRAHLENIGAFNRGLQRHRLLFCSTTMGIVSIVRQLQPTSHIESKPTVVEGLHNKVYNVVHVVVRDDEASAEKQQSTSSPPAPPSSAPQATGTSPKASTAAPLTPDFTDLQDCVGVLRGICKLDDEVEHQVKTS